MPRKARTHYEEVSKRNEVIRQAHRPTAAARGYDAEWAAISKSFLEAHPMCAHCMASGKYVAAVNVDHIRPHCGDNGLRLDLANLQALCQRCHSHKTAAEDGGFGNARVQRD